MKRYTIIIGRVNQDVMMHVNQFFKEASLIERVKLEPLCRGNHSIVEILYVNPLQAVPLEYA